MPSPRRARRAAAPASSAPRSSGGSCARAADEALRLAPSPTADRHAHPQPQVAGSPSLTRVRERERRVRAYRGRSANGPAFGVVPRVPARTLRSRRRPPSPSGARDAFATVRLARVTEFLAGRARSWTCASRVPLGEPSGSPLMAAPVLRRFFEVRHREAPPSSSRSKDALGPGRSCDLVRANPPERSRASSWQPRAPS